EGNRAVAVRQQTERAGIAEKVVLDAVRRHQPARDDVGTRRRLRMFELVTRRVLSEQDEVAARVISGLWDRRRQHLLPRGGRVSRIEGETPRRECICCERAPKGDRDALTGRREQHTLPILRRDELGDAARTARDERDAVLDALVDRVRRVVLERRHDGERSWPSQALERVALVEPGSEGRFDSVREEPSNT